MSVSDYKHKLLKFYTSMKSSFLNFETDTKDNVKKCLQTYSCHGGYDVANQ